MKRASKTQRNDFNIRLKNAIKELDEVWNFEYVIVNYSIEKTVEQIETILLCEEIKRKENVKCLIEELKNRVYQYKEV